MRRFVRITAAEFAVFNYTFPPYNSTNHHQLHNKIYTAVCSKLCCVCIERLMCTFVTDKHLHVLFDLFGPRRDGHTQAVIAAGH